jgi:hypothetical protein
LFRESTSLSNISEILLPFQLNPRWESSYHSVRTWLTRDSFRKADIKTTTLDNSKMKTQGQDMTGTKGNWKRNNRTFDIILHLLLLFLKTLNVAINPIDTCDPDSTTQLPLVVVVSHLFKKHFFLSFRQLSSIDLTLIIDRIHFF